MPAAKPFTTRAEGVGVVPRKAVRSAEAVDGSKREKAKGKRHKGREKERIT
jgi:hypothetical protein